jgi:hypothetical protein
MFRKGKTVKFLEGMIDLAVYELVTHMEGVLLKDLQKLWIECRSGYLELMNPEKLRKMQRCYADLQLSMMHYIYTIFRNTILITEDEKLLEKANREGNQRRRLLRAGNLLHKVKAH